MPALAALAVAAALASTQPFDLHGPATPPLQQGALVRGRVPAGTTGLTLDGKPVAVAPDGSFIIGFGRDATAATLAATTPQGEVTAPLTIEARTYNIQSLPGVAKVPVPDAEFEARRPVELAAITAARAGLTTDVDGWKQRFIKPAAGRISGVYGSQRIFGGVPANPHTGLDIAAPAGAPVVAPADGVVRLAQGPFTLEGNLVLLDHGYGLVSAFLHLSRIDVSVGQRIAQGERIGRVGGTGRTSGPHLHWGLNWVATRLDPALLLAATPKPSTDPKP